MRDRGALEGLRAIVRFNWPWYAIAGAVVVASFGVARWTDDPRLRAVAWILSIGGTWFVLASSLASHWVYDRSDLYRFGWLGRVDIPLEVDGTPRFVFCHAGFDECSGLLARALPAAEWRILDHHAPATMTEPSIRRARLHTHRADGSQNAPYDAWPIEDGSASAVFAMLAIHELRTPTERSEWFAQARRCLAPGAPIVLVEHVRDLANLLAFGPGAFHFHPAATWQRSWESGGLVCRDRYAVTPFVRVFVLGAP